MKTILFLGVSALFVLHNDVWLWERSERFLGLPVGLSYHVLYCLAVVGMMALLVRFGWTPEGKALEETDDGSEDTPT